MGVTVVLVQEQALCHKGVVCGGLVLRRLGRAGFRCGKICICLLASGRLGFSGSVGFPVLVGWGGGAYGKVFGTSRDVDGNCKQSGNPCCFCVMVFHNFPFL
ncbi:MAG: hypothetical protein HFG60_06530 [Lachnospiraceae bacterium]|nr:hypothetical protein [Lachnospiraceae bacterium]MCI9184608.1 hypothetical protein [Lachnospiraceae bacterium]